MSDDRLISSLRAFNVPTANRNITAINQPLADLRNLVVVVTQLKQGVDSLGGTRGGAYDRAVTFKDLSTLGLVSFKEVASGSVPSQIGQNGGPFLPLTGGTLTGPLTINTNDGLPLATPVANTMLQLVGPDGGQPRIFLDTFSSTGSANVSFRTARGTRSAPTALRSGDEMLRITALGYGATAYSTTQRGMLRFSAVEDWSDTAQGTRFSISTVAAGGVVSAVVATFDNNAVALAENLSLTGPDLVGGGRTTEARIAPNRFFFRQPVGDDSSAGTIDYRGYDPTGLSIVGAGTASGNHLVRLYDNVIIAGATTLTGGATSLTPAAADNSTKVATTAFVNSAIAAGGGAFLPLTGGALSGPGNLTVGGTLGVTGDATFAGSLAVDGNLNVTTALLRLLGADFAGGGATNTARFAPNRWIFRQKIGDDVNAGAIDYRGYDAGSLSIVGAGTTAGSRLIRLLDNVVIPGTLSVIGATTLATATATTPATADNSTSLATTAFVKAQGYVTGGPYLLLTGGTISGALTVSGATTLGAATAPTVATADSSTSLATTAFVKAQGYATTAALGAYLPLTGGTVSGALTVTGITTMGNWLALNGADLVGSGRTTEARVAPNRLLFRQPAGDEPSAGTIDYRGYDPAALSIVGAGTAGGNRLVRLFDNLVIPGTLVVSGATTLATATATTPATADNSTSLATTAFVKSQGYATAAALGGYLPLTGGTISGTLGVGGAAQARLYVFGTTQATPAINTAGVLPYLMLDDANTGAGAGGGIIFSAGTGAWRFGAIVGYVTSGSNNSQGDIVFSTRRVVTDATLTEAMRIRGNGSILASAPVICTTIGSPPIGQFHMAGNPAGTGYGSFWYNDGSFTYLLLTANNDALGSYNSLRPFMVDNATGLIAIGHGVNITGLTQILSSSATNVLKIVNAGGQNLQIYDDTNEHIEASTVLWINGNTHARTNFGGSISVAGVVEATGSIAGLQFDDRGGVSPTEWTWYAIGGKGTLYNNVNGDVFSVGVAGALTTFGNVNGANNKFFFWKDTTGALKQGFGMSSDNNYYISDGARYIIMNGWTVPIADNTMKCGEPSRAWNIVQSYAFTNSSDRRLKRDIEALPADCLGLVRAIDPVQFRWRQGLDSDRQHWGFVAQDVGAAMHARGIDFGGHVIGDDPDATEALSVTEMIAVLWRAVQELAGRA